MQLLKCPFCEFEPIINKHKNMYSLGCNCRNYLTDEKYHKNDFMIYSNFLFLTTLCWNIITLVNIIKVKFISKYSEQRKDILLDYHKSWIEDYNKMLPTLNDFQKITIIREALQKHEKAIDKIIALHHN